MPYSTHIIKLLEEIEPSLRKVLIAILEEIERQREESITRKEFLEFARHTDENFQKVWTAINELTEAQKKSEQRLTRIEKAVEELTEAQKKTEQRVNELTEAQKKTEAEVESLARSMKELKKMVGGLSDSVGYGLEDRIFPYIREFALKEYGIEVEILDRRNVVYPDGRYDEVNIYVEGRRNGEKIYLIGECKARPGKNDVKRFAERLRRIERYLGGRVEAFVVGSYYSPEVERYLKDKYSEIRVMKSYEFWLKYGQKNIS